MPWWTMGIYMSKSLIIINISLIKKGTKFDGSNFMNDCTHYTSLPW